MTMEGRWGVLIIMHGRSGTTIDPRIPTAVPGRSTSGFHRPGKALLAPSAKRRERCVLGEPHEGRAASSLLKNDIEAEFLSYG